MSAISKNIPPDTGNHTSVQNAVLCNKSHHIRCYILHLQCTMCIWC